MTDAPIEPTSNVDPVDAALASLTPAPDPNDAKIDKEIAKLEAADAEPEEPKEKTEPLSKLQLKIYRAEKAEREAKKALQAREKAAQEQIQAARAEADELRSLFSKLNSKEGLEKLLAKAGVDFNSLAQAYLGLDPQKQTAEQKLEALEKRLAEREAQEKTQREAWEKQRADVARRAAHQSDVQGVHAFAKANPDKYELLSADQSAVEEVVSRANKFLDEHGKTSLTEEERVQVLDHFCTVVEAECFDRYKPLAENLSKLKKLKGIFSHNTSEPNADTLAHESLDPDQELLDRINDTKSAKPITKFLTNETTLSAPPIASPKKTYLNSGDELLDQVIEQHQRAMRSQRTV